MLTDIRLHDLLEPGARALGFEVLAVEKSGRGSSTVLRVYIDGPNGVTVDDCAAVSRQLSAILDVEDPIPDHYTLEVSSPGLDRPLSKREHFEAVVGERVKLKAHHLIEGRRRFDGVLRAVDSDGVTLDVDGEAYQLAFSNIAKARLVPDYDELKREL